VWVSYVHSQKLSILTEDPTGGADKRTIHFDMPQKRYQAKLYPDTVCNAHRGMMDDNGKIRHLVLYSKRNSSKSLALWTLDSPPRRVHSHKRWWLRRMVLAASFALFTLAFLNTLDRGRWVQRSVRRFHVQGSLWEISLNHGDPDVGAPVDIPLLDGLGRSVGWQLQVEKNDGTREVPSSNSRDTSSPLSYIRSLVFLLIPERLPPQRQSKSRERRKDEDVQTRSPSAGEALKVSPDPLRVRVVGPYAYGTAQL